MSLSLHISTAIGNGRNSFWQQLEGITPLVVFRILFGLVFAYGALRFMAEGWIETLLAEPKFFFSFWGFDWIPRPNRICAYMLYGIITISAVAVSFGYRYRWSVGILLFSFTYAELLDATNYLNHYYLVILLTALLLFVPAHSAFSLDVLAGRVKEKLEIPKYYRYILLFQLAIVYVFAGLAKVNADWLLEAMPMAIWLPERAHYPIVGQLFEQPWVAFAFSWAGCLYDLTIVGWLLWKPTRKWAYMVVIIFHVLTWTMFNIGLFPLIMMTSTLLFFEAEAQEKFLRKASWGLEYLSAYGELFLARVVLWNSNPGLAGAGLSAVFGVPNSEHISRSSFLKNRSVLASDASKVDPIELEIDKFGFRSKTVFGTPNTDQDDRADFSKNRFELASDASKVDSIELEIDKFGFRSKTVFGTPNTGQDCRADFSKNRFDLASETKAINHIEDEFSKTESSPKTVFGTPNTGQDDRADFSKNRFALASETKAINPIEDEFSKTESNPKTVFGTPNTGQDYRADFSKNRSELGSKASTESAVDQNFDEIETTSISVFGTPNTEHFYKATSPKNQFDQPLSTTDQHITTCAESSNLETQAPKNPPTEPSSLTQTEERFFDGNHDPTAVRSSEHRKASPPLPSKKSPFQSKLLSVLTPFLLALYFAIQLTLPLRSLAYPGPAAWGEEGYRFGWRVMLVEKSGNAIFSIIDQESGRRAEVNNLDYLTPYQEKQMAIQPDFILQFAHHLAEDFNSRHGFTNPVVHVESFVALNGRRSRRLIDEKMNLATSQNGLAPKPWILPFER